ncbi:LCP family protein [Virgibacillus sp. W0430]|uniref:LCP family protein n=1 Tax=Virgibacillus sp. W0430 TaxID=3391580 RepID=UPI003F479ED3
MSESKSTRLNNLKSKKKKKMLIYIVLPISVILLSVISFGIHLYMKAQNTVNDSFEEIDRENQTSDLREEAVNPIDDNVSVLIIGVDDSEKRGFENSSRSDTLLLATFNKTREDVKLLTIPRDSYVYVPEVGYHTKINHAHAFGGPKATMDTVEEFLNVPVDYYVRLDFEAFIEIVDTLGGIQYDVPYEIHEMDSTDKKDAIHLLPGYQKLNGEEALALARTRKYDSDIERGKRQQEIIKTVVKEAASASALFKLDNLMEAVGDNMTTNLSFKDMRSFITYGLQKSIPISTVNLNGHGGKMNDGLWYYQVEEESRVAIEKELRSHLELPIKDLPDSELQTERNSNQYEEAQSY